jgi:hypothetical protein
MLDPNRLEDRLTELEQWTRAEEDRIHQMLKALEKRLFAVEEKLKKF